MLRGCLVCAICNSNSFHSFILKLHNDCSYIEEVHLLFCILFMIFVFGGLELGHFFFCKMLRGCLVCVISNSKSFYSLKNDYSYIEHVHLIFCAYLINIVLFFMAVELRYKSEM